MAGSQDDGFEHLPDGLRKALEACARQAGYAKKAADAYHDDARLTAANFSLAPGAEEVATSYVGYTTPTPGGDRGNLAISPGRFAQVSDYLYDLAEALDYIAKNMNVVNVTYRRANDASKPR